MIPMDTVKTRLVTQVAQPGVEPYKGVLQTLSRVVKEEGLGSVYRSLTPRLVSVVPMIGIQVTSHTRPAQAELFTCVVRQLVSSLTVNWCVTYGDL